MKSIYFLKVQTRLWQECKLRNAGAGLENWAIALE